MWRPRGGKGRQLALFSVVPRASLERFHRKSGVPEDVGLLEAEIKAAGYPDEAADPAHRAKAVDPLTSAVLRLLG